MLLSYSVKKNSIYIGKEADISTQTQRREEISQIQIFNPKLKENKSLLSYSQIILIFMFTVFVV